jgi:hypothetical protein
VLHLAADQGLHAQALTRLYRALWEEGQSLIGESPARELTGLASPGAHAVIAATAGRESEWRVVRRVVAKVTAAAKPATVRKIAGLRDGVHQSVRA